jgi:hypothetical protein
LVSSSDNESGNAMRITAIMITILWIFLITLYPKLSVAKIRINRYL